AKRLAPAKALEWMETAWSLAEQADKARRDDDTLTDARRKEIEEGVSYRGNVAPDYLRALKMAGVKSVPASLRTFLEGPMPPKKSDWTDRYRSLALLALVEGHQADALAYYQQALFAREKVPQYYRGRIEDSLQAEAKKAFLAEGGTEKTFALWWQPPVKAKEPVEGRWEKPKKPLPSFELADTTGKTWKLTELRGKTLLISLWATWCSYCRLELPHLQKLYEKVKDRQDVRVMSFNVDEELGLVEPFMKDQGLTFPALAAYGFVRDLLDNYTIPQVWLVDPDGKLLATQIGFDSADTDWVNSMLARIDAAKRGEAPAEAE
ncbi:MAG: TlpA disulfide reductase family protein, partial [Bryobacteraceae bacterium]